MAWTVITTFVLDQLFGYQSANKIKDNLVSLASRRSGRSLGGTRAPGLPNFAVFDPFTHSYRSKYPGVGPHDVDGYVDIEIDGTLLGGLTCQARVEVRTQRPGVTITPKVRNMTDSSDAGTGVACSVSNADYSGANQKQTIALTIPSGVKKYRLMYTLSSNALEADTWCGGEIECFATA